MEIDRLSIEIESSASNASQELDKLSSSFGRLKNATTGIRLTSVSNSISKIASSLNGLNTSKIDAFATSLTGLSNIAKGNSGSALNQLKKLPETAEKLDGVDIDKFATSIERVTRAIKPLATEMEKVSNGFSALLTKTQRVITQQEKLTKSNSTQDKSWKSLGSRVLKVGVILSVFRTVSNSLGQFVAESNNYVENLNLFSVAMGEYTEQALEYANTVSDKLGIDPSEWIRNQGIIMDMAKSFGVASEDAYTMSRALTQLSYDFSSLYNIPIAESMTKIQSAIAGEIEPVRRLGKDLSMTKLQQEAYNLGIQTHINAMSQQEKSMLRTIALLKQSQSAFGDMARTINSPANQMRIFNQQILLLKRSLGNVLIPAISAILPYFIALIQVIRMVVDIIGALIGFELPEFDYSGLESSSGGFADNMKDAEESAKKIKNYTAGFDELNILNQEAGAGLGNIGVGGSGDYDALAKALQEQADILDEAFLGNVQSKVNEIVDKIKEWTGLNEEIDTWAEFFETRLGKILILVTAIGAGLLAWKVTWNIVDFITKLGKVGISVGKIGGAFLAITGFATALYGVIDAIITGLDWENLLIIVGGLAGLVTGMAISFGAIGATIGLVVAGIVLMGVGMYDAAKNGLTYPNLLAIAGGIGIIAITLGGVAGAMVAALGGIALLIIGFKDFIKNGTTAKNVAAIAIAIGLIGVAIGGAAGILVASILGGIALVVLFGDKVYGVVTWITMLFANLGKAIVNILGYIGQAVYDAIAFVVNIIWGIVTVVENVIKAILNFLIGLLEAGKTIFSNLGKAITHPFEAGEYAVASFVQNSLQKLKSLIENLNKILDIFGMGIDTTNLENAISLLQTRKDQLQEELKFEDVGEAFNRGMQTYQYRDVGEAFTAVDYTMKPVFDWDNVFAEGWGEEAYNIGADFGKDMQEGIRDKFSEMGLDGMGLEDITAHITANGSATAETQEANTEIANTQLPNLQGSVDNLLETTDMNALTTGDWQKNMQDLTSNMPTTKETTENTGNIIDVIESAAQRIVSAVNNVRINIINNYSSGGEVGTFATGGFPEDGLFFANSRELVGRFSNGRTAVANNEQITEGIKRAVYEAMVSAGTSSQETIVNNVVNLDGEVIYRNQENIKRNRGVNIGLGAFAR